MKVAGLAVWGAAQRRTKLTDEQVPISFMTLASALPVESGSIGPKCSTVPSVPGVKQVGQVKQLFFILRLFPDEDVLFLIVCLHLIA